MARKIPHFEESLPADDAPEIPPGVELHLLPPVTLPPLESAKAPADPPALKGGTAAAKNRIVARKKRGV